MKEFYEQNKTAIKIAAIMIGVAIIVIIVQNVVENINYKKELTRKLTVLGEVYYEELAYTNFYNEEDNSLLELYSEGGYRVNLTNLISSIYLEDPEVFINKRTNETCDYANSYVIIYPKEPYGLEDYKIEASLECGF